MPNNLAHKRINLCITSQLQSFVSVSEWKYRILVNWVKNKFSNLYRLKIIFQIFLKKSFCIKIWYTPTVAHRYKATRWVWKFQTQILPQNLPLKQMRWVSSNVWFKNIQLYEFFCGCVSSLSLLLSYLQQTMRSNESLAFFSTG